MSASAAQPDEAGLIGALAEIGVLAEAVAGLVARVRRASGGAPATPGPEPPVALLPRVHGEG
jgi:hypothetical protein